ncbi:hypothetical protein JCM10207_005903 [Rhodosporidiobolus poonsookiae]
MAPPRPQHLQSKTAQDDPTLLPSEDEDDDDFRLSDHDDGSDSGEDSDEDDDGGRAGKRARTDAAQEPAMTKTAIDDLWASFNDAGDDPYAKPAPSASAAASSSSTGASAAAAGAGQAKGKAKDDGGMVKIEIEYEYAGEKIAQEKLVARASAEAQAWLARYPSASATSTGKPSAAPPASSTTTSSLDALFGPSPSSSSSAPVPPPASAEVPKPAPRPAGGAPKRKAGGRLAAAAAKLGVGKAAKLNTLEKSKLDWNNQCVLMSQRTRHVATTGDADDLAVARKSGYLDQRDFLDRVEASREDEYEKLKAGAARKRQN